MKYVFRDTPLTIKNARQADPQQIGEALAAIMTARGPRLHPRAVVAEARDPEHPLHAHFEWDDTKAAIAYRLDQAREIIRIVRIDNDTSEPPRAYLSISEGRGGTSYRAREDVLGSSSLQALVLAQAERELEAFQRRYRDMVEVCEFIDKARAAVARRRERRDPPPDQPSA